MSTLAERLDDAMKRKPGTRQADLVRVTGATSPSVSNWFGGRTKTLDIKHAQILGKFFGCDPMWLSTGYGLPNWIEKSSQEYQKTVTIQYSTIQEQQKTYPAQQPTLEQALAVLGRALAQELPHDVREDVADALAKLARRGGTDRDQHQVILLLQDNSITASNKKAA